ncbi:MAG: ATP-binding cassette domain-containing protein [Desulfobacteraceae bacterium]|nr:ATP-binding cassette domain-containing protein [Desulfobacteraceae bacterium]
MMDKKTIVDNPIMVSAEHVGLVRHDRKGEVATILADISFSARRGEVTAIVGPSGGGKSSLIRLINRLDDPTSGKILLDKEDIMHLDPLALRQRVAMVLQKPFMFEGTVLSNLQRPFLFRKEPLPTAGSAAVHQVMELVRLSHDLLERDARTLSLGEQQRVNLARALITEPHVLLLDEPTSALDRPTGDQLAATFHDICTLQRLSVILVTHDLRMAGKIADYLIYLEGGRIREAGRPDDLLTNPTSLELRRFLAEPEDREGEYHA